MVDKMVCIIVNTTVMTAAQFILFLRLSEFRFERRKVYLAAVIFAAVCCSVSIGISLANNCERSTELVLVTLTLPSLVFFYIISKYRGARFFTTYCIADMSIALVEVFVYMLGLLLHGGNFTIDWISRTVAVLAWSAALFILIGDKYRKALKLVQKGWWLILPCVLSMYVLVSLITASPTPIAQRMEDVPLAMLMVATMELTVLIIIRVLYSTLEAKEQQLRQESLQSRLSMAESQYALMSENMDQMRRLRHDMKYHMNVIRGFLEQQNYEELRKYLDDYQSELAALDTQLPLFTKNQTVNILAGYYARRAQEEGIRTDFTIQLPEDMPIARTQLTVLLGNLWQNALDACRTLPHGRKRFIRTSIGLQQGKFMLKCTNSAAHVRRDKNGRFLSTKGPRHGSGLAGVEDVADIHGGFCEFAFDGQLFTASVVLPLAAEEAGAP